MVSKENIKKGDSNMEYIYGVHCGDANCYSCTTMKGECAWLDSKDKLEDKKNETK